MYAIVEIAGQQFKVEKDQEIFVHRLGEDSGSSVEFDKVLILENEGTITVGSPVVEGALIKAKILEHMKGDKVLVFRKKRRKGFQKENGHRQYLSKVKIEDILTGVKSKAKKEAEIKQAPVAKKEEAVQVAKEKTEKPVAKATPKKEAVKEEEKPIEQTATAATVKEPVKEEKPEPVKAEKKTTETKAEATPGKEETGTEKKKADEGTQEEK